MSENDNLREAVITILEDHISGSFEGLDRDVVILSGFEEAADAILSLPIRGRWWSRSSRLSKAPTMTGLATTTAPCAYCGAVRAKPCNDMLCPWAPQ
jgi:hypothetical protein